MKSGAVILAAPTAASADLPGTALKRGAERRAGPRAALLAFQRHARRRATLAGTAGACQVVVLVVS